MKQFLDIFSKKKVETKKQIIEVDNRERNSLVPAELMKLGFGIKWAQLPVADYIINGVAIERKTVADLKESIINRRIFSQLTELKQYEKCFLIVEGINDEDIYSGGLNANALRGMLLSVALDYGVGIVYTRDAIDSAKYLDVLARRKGETVQGIRASKIQLSDEEKIQFILEGFPNVGAVKAKELIAKFSSLKEIFNASVEELEEVLGKRAGEFKDLIDYKGR